MSYYPCDQFAADALSIGGELLKETGIKVDFDIAQVEKMVQTIEDTVPHLVIDHDELQGVLRSEYDFRNDATETAYMRLLDKIFERRKYWLGAKSSMNSRNGKFAPFAPIEQYD